jgi:hypothetical protein
MSPLCFIDQVGESGACSTSDKSSAASKACNLLLMAE